MIPPVSELALLIREAQKGDHDAFRQLYNMLVDRVYAYTVSRLSRKDEALDCTQQTFIELWKALSRFIYSSDPQFYGFLFTITKRQILKSRESIKRLPSEMLREEEVADVSGNIIEKKAVQEALEKLQPIDREIIILHHWSRYTFSEIGEMLSLTESNVRVKHHRTLKHLKNLILPSYE